MSRVRGRERPAPGGRRQAPRATPAPRPARELPLRHPAAIVALLVATACVLFTVTYRIRDTDLWQHLTVGKAIWSLHQVPGHQIWTWPTYGASYVLPSWGFRALLWPFWQAGGVTGLFAWRWLTTFAAFGLLWAAARRMGARGFTPLVALVVASLAYRMRAQVRPESAAAVLFALEILILEARRAGGRDRTRWLVPIAWAWANLHISYPLAFVLLAIHHAGSALEAALRRRRRGALAPQAAGAAPATPHAALLSRDIVTALVMAAVSFLNPFGWRALAEPFQYLLFWRHEAIFQVVTELEPVTWSVNLLNGVPLLVTGWPVLILWRARRAFDGVEALLALFLIPLALTTQRFIGLLALGAAPYLARDLDAWVDARRWPRWTAYAWARALLAAAACVAAGIAEWSRPAPRPGVGLEMRSYPVRACDFIAQHGVRGRAYNDFFYGGYVLWRFWPERDRLPFMDIHQSGTLEDRRLAARVPVDPAAWRELDGRHRFDYALLTRSVTEGDHSLDVLDADTSFALVFMDDAAALYLRRAGPLAAVADSFAYRALPAGPAGLRALGAALTADASGRAAAAAELERSVRASEFNAVAHGTLANLAMIEGRYADARRELTLALAANPTARSVRERIAAIDRMQRP